MRRSLTDLGGRIATCCTASEAGLVVILPDNITGQEAGVEMGGLGRKTSMGWKIQLLMKTG